MKKSIGYPVFFMVIVTVVFSSILAFLNYSTADRIDFNQNNKIRRKLLYAFNIQTENEDPQAIEDKYNENITEKKINNKTIYTAEENGNIIGYAFPIEGSALWGTVKGFAAISKDFKTLLGIDFVSHSETPGLGGRIDESWFKEQFRGINLESSQEGKYIIYNPKPGGNVDAISGATLTSDSVREFLNVDIEDFLSFAKEVNLDGQY
ncbi:FMN-binding protein [Sporosalibacterium faouarense]|uniref:FMN-binding protein n=1 Tax=Sporosalibacterium faouarense TaxID=516123 RepID=UPI00141C66AB|nr:FMN-binding protein [Sporosalibacterium faouarense]MTI46421.1 FMN-binding protein [Bacillota bacterium]